MPNKTKFPRSTIKQLVRKYQPKEKKRVTNNADILIYLEYLLFLKQVATESRAIAIKNNEKEILPEHIAEVIPRVLRKFKG